MYCKIIIPEVVYIEIEQGKTKQYYQDLLAVNWIEICSIQDKYSLRYFMDLDFGEAEAIVLAVEQNADLILIDEQLGRHHAKQAGLKITGTLGILLKAEPQGITFRG